MVAVVFERLDKALFIFSGNLVSGHTVKHLVAALALLCIVMYVKRREVDGGLD